VVPCFFVGIPHFLFAFHRPRNAAILAHGGLLPIIR
jgi:hypothetical protein